MSTLNIGFNGTPQTIEYDKNNKLSSQLSALSSKGAQVTIGNETITLSGERQKDTLELNLMVLNFITFQHDLNPHADKKDAIASLDPANELLLGLGHSFGGIKTQVAEGRNVTYAFMLKVIGAPMQLIAELYKEQGLYAKEATKDYTIQRLASKDRQLSFKVEKHYPLTDTAKKKWVFAQKRLALGNGEA